MLNGIFHEINHPATIGGTSMTMEPPHISWDRGLIAKLAWDPWVFFRHSGVDLPFFCRKVVV